MGDLCAQGRQKLFMTRRWVRGMDRLLLLDLLLTAARSGV